MQLDLVWKSSSYPALFPAGVAREISAAVTGYDANLKFF